MIDPAEAIEVLLEELKRQKAEGVTRVSVSPESLQLLKTWGAGTKAPLSSATKSATVSPETIKTVAKKPPEITPSVAQAKAEVSAIPLPKPPEVSLPQGSKVEQMQWLQKTVSECAETQQHLKKGMKPMLGFGSLDAKVVLVGEVPSLEEIEEGRPFVGDVGNTLYKILKETGLTEKDIYLANTMVWRPATASPHHKAIPKEWELAFNKPYLLALLKIIHPQCIIALGQQATHVLTGTRELISNIRGNWQEVDGIPLMPTFHPSYIMHSPSNSNKRKIWEDCMQVMEKCNLPISPKQRDYFLSKPSDEN